MEKNTVVNRFRLIANIEGWSFLILLFIAMPLKYKFGFPLAVKITGSAHGFLFVLYMLLLLQLKLQVKWSIKKCFIAFIASLLPFGTFVFDKKMDKID